MSLLPELSTMSSQWRAYFGKRDWYHVGRKVRHENLVSNQLRKFKLSPFQKIKKLTFPALALPQSENRNCMLSILGGEKLSLSRWKERIAWSSSSRDGVALRKSALKCSWLFLASVWHRPVHQRSFQTVTSPQPHFLFFISSTTSAKLNTIVPMSKRKALLQWRPQILP